MNDIKKNLLLIESIILDESFKDAMTKFTQDADEKEVQEYIDLYKDLSSRKIITGREKDIGYWIKQDWNSFRDFVDSKKEVKTKRALSKIQKKDSIIVYKDNNKIVVIPLSKESSSYYGKHTRWCTAATESKNYFNSYFIKSGITMFYVLLSDGNKFAAAYKNGIDSVECYDNMDNEISLKRFSDLTKITLDEMKKWHDLNAKKISKFRNINLLEEDEIIEILRDKPELIKDMKSPSEQMQLVSLEKFGQNIKNINNPSEEVQLAAVKRNPNAIQFIEKPTEKAQIAAVKHDGNVLEFITNPSEEVQLAAVRRNGLSIRFIKEPTLEIQIQSVKNKGLAIQYIDNPSDEIKLAAVNDNGLAIQYIDNPSDEIKLAAVKDIGEAIRYIDNPSDEIKLAAVNDNGEAIRYIDNPSEDIQVMAVKKTTRAFSLIQNPSEKVQIEFLRADKYNIDYFINNGKELTENVMIGYVLAHREGFLTLVSKGIKTTYKVKLAAITAYKGNLNIMINAGLEPDDRLRKFHVDTWN